MSDRLRDETEFDYIIVGGGSAGCVLAARLSEDTSISVLLVEAGSSSGGLWTHIPLGVGKALADPSLLWSVTTGPEPGLDGRGASWVSGKLLGGSSCVNGLLFVRGHPRRYDQWAGLGCPGWDWASVLPYFRRLEDCRFASGATRSVGGPIPASRVLPDPISEAFLAACEELGLPRLDDYNDGNPEGCAYLQLSARNGLRVSAARGYLPSRAMGRENLVVRCETLVHRVVFETDRAVAVEYRRAGGTRVARARREVILCAGAVRSPQLLELSGIGDLRHLSRLSICAVHPSPHVGENLQDHLMVRASYECKVAQTVNDMVRHPLKLLHEAARFCLTRKGMFSSPSLTATAFVRSASSAELPDLRLQVGLTSSEGRLASGARGLDPHSGFHIGAYPLYPISRGSCHARTADSQDPPSITAGYLTDASDRDAAVRGFEVIRELSATTALREVVLRETRPGPATRDRASILRHIAATGHTCWHPVGTCRMGNDALAVVDPQLRVRGVRGLRVVDASVFPVMPASNTNIPVIMLAERAADLIRGCAGTA